MWGVFLWREVDVATYTDALNSASCMKVSVVYNLSNGNFHKDILSYIHCVIIITTTNVSVRNLLSYP